MTLPQGSLGERKEQGLPSRVGVIPLSAVVETEERWRSRQQRKHNRRRAVGKNRRSTHNARSGLFKTTDISEKGNFADFRVSDTSKAI